MIRSPILILVAVVGISLFFFALNKYQVTSPGAELAPVPTEAPTIPSDLTQAPSSEVKPSTATKEEPPATPPAPGPLTVKYESGVFAAGPVAIFIRTPALNLDGREPLPGQTEDLLVRSQAPWDGEVIRLRRQLLELDPEIANRIDIPADKKTSTIEIWWVSEDRKLVLYLMTPSSTSCYTGGEGWGCPGNKLKLFDLSTNEVRTVADTGFTLKEWGGVSFAYLKSQNKLFVREGNYGPHMVIYDIARNVSEVRQALLFGENLISYDQTASQLLFENLLSNAAARCRLAEQESTNFANGFDYSYFSLSPNGKHVIWTQIDTGQFASDISHIWQEDGAYCFQDKNLFLNGVRDMRPYNNWHNNAKFFSLSGYTSAFHLYDFEKRRLVASIPWESATQVGWVNNYGYHGEIDLGYGGFKIRTVPDGNAQDMLLVSPRGEQFLLNTYYEPNMRERSTAGGQDYFAPSIFFAVGKDKDKEGLFHIVALEKYRIYQAIDIVIAK